MQVITRRVGPWWGALVLLAAGAACHQPGRSIVRVHVVAGAVPEASLATVSISVRQNGRALRDDASFDWVAGGVSGGVYVSADASGAIEVEAAGLSAGHAVIAESASATVTVTPGQNTSAVVEMVLVATGPGPGDGGATDGAGDVGVDAPDGGGGDARDGGGDVTGSGGTAGIGAGGTIGAGGAGSGGTGSGGSGAGGSGAGGNVSDGGSDVPITSGAWQPARPVETNIDAPDSRPQVAIDETGHALAVWQHGTAIWFNRYDPVAATWGTEAAVTGALGQNVQIAMDGAGAATIIYQAPANVTGLMGVWASSAAAGSNSWSTPARLSSGNALDAHVATSRSGVAIAAWTENTGGNQFQLFVTSRPAAAAAWVTPVIIKPATDSQDRVPALALDDAGNGFVIWQQVDALASTTVWTSRFSAGAFATPVAIETAVAASDSGHIAMDGAGTAVATWRQLDTPQGLWARFFRAGAWEAPAQVTSGTFISSTLVPHVAFNGAAALVWSQTIANGTNQARLSRNVGGAWSTPAPLETDNLTMGDLGQDVSPQVGISGATVTAIWRKKLSNGLMSLWARRMDPGGVLGPATRLEVNDVRSVFGHQLAVARDGTAVAVWYYGTDLDIWSAVFR